MPSEHTYTEEDRSRYKNHRDRFLNLLEGGITVPQEVLGRISRAVSARISELAAEGYQIERTAEGYRLTGKGDPVPVVRKPADPDRLKNYVKFAWKGLTEDQKDAFCEWFNDFVTEEVGA